MALGVSWIHHLDCYDQSWAEHSVAPFLSGEKVQMADQSRYITRGGFLKLQSELSWLWKEERPRVTEAVSVAAALGDRSENADYIYGKKRLREIDRRIRFLTKRIEELNVVDEGPRKDSERVYFGAWVTVEDEEGETVRYQLVGPDEFDASARRISVDSPVGRALMGKRIDDEVAVRRPKGEALYTITKIEYKDAEALFRWPNDGSSQPRSKTNLVRRAALDIWLRIARLASGISASARLPGIDHGLCASLLAGLDGSPRAAGSAGPRRDAHCESVGGSIGPALGSGEVGRPG